MSTPARPTPVVGVVLVALGGAVGCLARTGLESALGEWQSVVVGQLLANVTGAFALGLLTARLASAALPHADHASLLLGTGLLGGWTTYSGLALQALVTADRLGLLAGALVLLVSVVSGLAAAGAGLRLGRLPRRGASR